MQALRNLRDRGYTGELVGRMVITEDSDPYNDILWFFSVEYPKFDGVHWQCNFEFTEKDYWKDIKSWIGNIYNPAITRFGSRMVRIMQVDGQSCVCIPLLGLCRTY